MKPTGTSLSAGDEFAELETIKATVSLPSPVAGEIVAVNEDLETSPEMLNQDPYGKGWLAIVHAADWDADRCGLLDPQAYLSAMRAQAMEEMP